MITTEIKGVDAVINTLIDIPKQVRFATSQALNDTAKDVQGWTIGGLLPSKFILRSRGAPWWRPGNKLGFNIQFASKDKLESRIGSSADFLDEQEHGGQKSISGRFAAIPTTATRTTPREVITKSKRPRAVLKRGAFFGHDSMAPGVYQRVGKARYPLRRLFTFRANVQITARLAFEKDGKRRAEQVYQGYFNRRITYALLTAK